MLQRERERVVFSKIGFICDAKSISYNNKIAREIKCKRSEYRRKKWVDYKKHEIKRAVQSAFLTFKKSNKKRLQKNSYYDSIG